MLLCRCAIPSAIFLESSALINFVGKLAAELVAGDALIDDRRRLGNDAVKAFGDDRHGNH